MSYRILKITSFYKGFLDDFYQKNNLLNKEPYEKQYKKLMNEKFAWADFFKLHIEYLGNEVIEVIHNAEFLQSAWQKEYVVKKNNNVVFEQIEFYKPEVIFFQDIKSFSGRFIKHIRDSFSFVKLIFGHSCSPYSEMEIQNFKHYDFILTCLPSFKKVFEKKGIKSYILYHGFEESVLDYICKDEVPHNNFVFIGSLVGGNDFHSKRIKYIERLLKEDVDLKLYASITKDTHLALRTKQMAYIASRLFYNIGLNEINQRISVLKKVSSCTKIPERTNFSKKIYKNIISDSYYGINMYNLLANSNIALNIHVGIAGKYAANMRLFETTGVGTLLFTEHKENIHEFFEPDYEIVTFNSIEECIEKSKWLINNPIKANEIALAGQKRTLKDHSLKNRFLQIDEIVSKHL